MKPTKYFSVLFLILTGLALTGNAQEKNVQKQRQQQRNFYRKTLQVDSAKAEQVALVQSNYKTALNALMADTSLRIDARRARVKALIDGKNQQLRQLLTPAQQEKMIPTTEREPAKAKQ